jgi:hypothetical protein
VTLRTVAFDSGDPDFERETGQVLADVDDVAWFWRRARERAVPIELMPFSPDGPDWGKFCHPFRYYAADLKREKDEREAGPTAPPPRGKAWRRRDSDVVSLAR